MEDGEVTISRMRGKVKYPGDFILAASMNPCPCGYYGSKRKMCKCTEFQINSYSNRLSGPLMDRIDIVVNSGDVEFEDLRGASQGEKSSTIKKRIEKARERQRKRYKDKLKKTNAQMSQSEIKKYCIIDKKGEELLKEAYTFLNLSVRAFDKLIRVARTIADLEGRENIFAEDLGEAIQYRI